MNSKLISSFIGIAQKKETQKRKRKKERERSEIVDENNFWGNDWVCLCVRVRNARALIGVCVFTMVIELMRLVERTRFFFSLAKLSRHFIHIYWNWWDAKK